MQFLSSPDIVDVDTLPSAGERGRVVVLTTDSCFYYDDGVEWINLSATRLVVVESGTTLTLTRNHHGKEIHFTNAGTKTVTLDDTATLGTDFVCAVVNLGAGALTIADGGMTANNNPANLPQYKSATIKATGTDTFLVTPFDIGGSGGVDTANSPNANEFARFIDADTIEGRTVAETRSDLGLATSDSPEFAAINVGAATDTTITRTGAGDIAIEGNVVYRAGGTDVPLTDGGTGASTAAGARTNLGVDTLTAVWVIDGGGSAITTGVKGDLQIPYAGTITGWRLLADQSGSIVIDVWKDTYANFPPTVADTIAGTEKPTLSGVNKNEDTTLSTWTTSVTAGDILRFNVDSATTVTRVTLEIFITRT